MSSFSQVIVQGRQTTRAIRFYLLVVTTLFALLPLLLSDPWLQHIMIMVTLYALLASAWNLLGGYCGQFSVGHSAFFGVAGYTMGILLVRANMNPVLGGLLGVGLAGLLALGVGLSSLRLTGIFFALATFSLAEILRKLALFHDRLTGGTLGLTVNVPNMPKIYYYFLSLLLMLVGFGATYFFERSRFGYYCLAIRENEDAAKSSGINTSLEKVKAAFLSALLTGAGGVLYAAYIGVIEPDVVFSFDLSIKIIIVAVIGGSGTLIGPLLGALIVVIPDELVRGWLGGSYASWSGIVYGIILVVTILLRPQGLRAFLNFIVPEKKD